MSRSFLCNQRGTFSCTTALALRLDFGNRYSPLLLRCFEDSTFRFVMEKHLQILIRLSPRLVCMLPIMMSRLECDCATKMMFCLIAGRCKLIYDTHRIAQLFNRFFLGSPGTRFPDLKISRRSSDGPQ